MKNLPFDKKKNPERWNPCYLNLILDLQVREVINWASPAKVGPRDGEEVEESPPPSSHLHFHESQVPPSNEAMGINISPDTWA